MLALLRAASRARPAAPSRRRPLATSATSAAAATPPLVLVVAAAILRRRRRSEAADAPPPPQVLLAQRTKGALAGLWEFPGGKIDIGTDPSPEHALARELDEELGLRGVAPSRLRPLAFASHAYEKFHLLMPLYALELVDGDDDEPRGVEGQALAWVTAEELAGGAYAMPPADDPLVAPVVAALAALAKAP